MFNSRQAVGGRMPRLDGVRAVAILMVLFEHLVTTSFGIGGAGVALFFVLSGYLITNNILSYRARLAFGEAARVFYWNRLVRLAPPFYVTLLVGFLIGVGAGRFELLMDAVYLTNIHVFAINRWNASGYLWSLAVEEQFYLVAFPALMLIPIKRLPGVLTATLVACVVFLLAMSMTRFAMFRALLPSSAYGLISGAGLAYAIRERRVSENLLCRWFDRRLLVASLVGLGAWLGAHHRYHEALTGAGPAALFALSVDGLAICLVVRSLFPTRFPRWAWLGWRPLTYVGTISYGLYVYHGFLTLGLERHYPTLMSSGLRKAAVSGLASFVAAVLSWHFLEYPLKRRLHLTGPRRTSPEPSADTVSV